MSFWDKAQNVDRRVIYALMFAVIALVLIKPVGLAIEIKKETQMAYDALAKIPTGSVIWLSADYGASSIPELLPAQKSVMRHAFGKGLRIVAGAMWNEGGNMIDLAWQDIQKDFPNKKYGVDFVNVGYKPGGAVLLERIATDAHQALLGMDHYGKPFSELPLMQEFKSFKDAKFIFEFVTGTPGEKDYIKMVTDKLKIPFATSATSVSVPEQMPLLQSGQLCGLVMGMAGAAEYEMLVGKPGTATAGMDAQSFAHVLIIGFIILGNLGYLLSGKSKFRRKA